MPSTEFMSRWKGMCVSSFESLTGMGELWGGKTPSSTSMLTVCAPLRTKYHRQLDPENSPPHARLRARYYYIAPGRDGCFRQARDLLAHHPEGGGPGDLDTQNRPYPYWSKGLDDGSGNRVGAGWNRPGTRRGISGPSGGSLRKSCGSRGGRT